jgi:dTDP-glucose 4,6-dehydratase
MPPVPPLPAADLDQVLARTEPLWQELRGARVFLTGGSGFFGAWLVESFLAIQQRLQLPAQLWMLCREPQAWSARFPHLAEHPALRLVPGDLAGLRAPGGAFHGIIHAAAGSDRPFTQFRTMVDGTLRVLDFAQASGARRILFTSSGAVYGPPPATREAIAEDDPGSPRPEDPATVYGQAKRASEGLCAAFAAEHGASAVLARCFAFVGPHLKLDANYAIGNFIRDALWGEAIRIQGDGTALRSYLYAGDLAAWLWTLYFRGPSALPVHVGSDRAISIAELAATVAAVLRPGLPVSLGAEPVPGRLPQCYVPALGRARGLGLAPWTGLEEAIWRTGNWYQRKAVFPS